MGKLARRLASLFSFRRIWGPALTILGLIGQAVHWGWQSLDTLGRLDVFWRVVETMGGSPAMIAAIISSWQFSLALIAVGIGYTVFVGEPEIGTQRHAWWPYVAASIFFICVTAMGIVAIYGATELYIRREIATGIAGLPRGAPDVGNPSRPQTPLYADNYGVITPDQSRILLVELPKLKEILPVVKFMRMRDDNDAWAYWSRFHDLFSRSGIDSPLIGDQTPQGPEQEGLMIEVRDPPNLPPSAQKLVEAFEIANIRLKPVKLPTNFMTDPNTPFLIFVGPRPIRWP
jgi:hypothetical protein